MRIGLVGTGDAAGHHARALLAVGGWTAVVARDTAKLAAFRTAVDVPAEIPVFESLEALLDARVCDAVILATPDGVHAAQVALAATRGVHVLVEKPLALSAADGSLAVASARAAGVHLAVGYHLRHHAAHRLMRERLGSLGRVRTVHVRWAWPDPAVDGWRARSLAFWSLAALGTHAIDLALLFGEFTSATPLEATGLTLPRGGIDQQAEVSLRIGEVLAHVSVSVVHRAGSRLVVSGDAGELEATGTLGARGDGALTHRAGRAVTPLDFEVVNPYAAQLRAFVADAAAGFSEDPTLMANLTILDRIHP